MKYDEDGLLKKKKQEIVTKKLIKNALKTNLNIRELKQNVFPIYNKIKAACAKPQNTYRISSSFLIK